MQQKLNLLEGQVAETKRGAESGVQMDIRNANQNGLLERSITFEEFANISSSTQGMFGLMLFP